MFFLSQTLKANEIKHPRDLYKQLRNLWAVFVSGAENFSAQEMKDLSRHPFTAQFPLTVAIAKLLFPEEKLYLPDSLQEPGLTELSLPELCQLTLLWALHGEKKLSIELASRILPLLKFSALCIPEERYDPLEFYHSVYLFYSYVGLKKEAALCKMAVFGSKDLFFASLEKALSSVFRDAPIDIDASFVDSYFGNWVKGDLAITCSAKGAGLGAFFSGEVGVRTFGPQFYPLTDSSRYGLSGLFDLQTIEKEKISGWVSTLGDPEVWLQIEAVSANAIHVRWAGLDPEKKGVFAFYVKAETAHVGDLVFRSRSLRRSRMVANEIWFNDKAFAICSRSARNFELIPLAGVGCFWHADFLIAFEMSSFDAEEWFSFKVQTGKSDA